MARITEKDMKKREEFVRQLAKELPQAPLDHLYSQVRKKFGTGMTIARISKLRKEVQSSWKDEKTVKVETPKDELQIVEEVKLPVSGEDHVELRIRMIAAELSTLSSELEEFHLVRSKETGRFELSYTVVKKQTSKMQL